MDSRALVNAAAGHDLSALESLLRSRSANIRDEKTGSTLLHIACSGPLARGGEKSSDGSSSSPDNHTVETSALATVNFLLKQGARWDELDGRGETAACVARRLGLQRVYDAIVASGVELEYGKSPSLKHRAQGTPISQSSMSKSKGVDSQNGIARVDSEDREDKNQIYLKSHLTFADGALLESATAAVVMDWEVEIYEAAVKHICSSKGLRTLNVGYGLGIVDRLFLQEEPAMHYIVEAHPQVLQHMRQTGWYDKPNVTILEGRWQDVLPGLVDGVGTFDAIYYDTYAEDHRARKEFYEQHVVKLLDRNGRFSFYHARGGDRQQVCYDVYTKVVEAELRDAGFVVQWMLLRMPELSQTWGTIRPYWVLDEYRLPVCKFL